MRKKVLFLLNAHSGKGQIKKYLLEIVDMMVKAGFEVTVYPTQAPEDATRMIAESADRFDHIVCSGGDGTLDEVVTGLIQNGSSTTIGYIPAGSTNDFANSLKIPKNVLQAADVAVNGEEFPCDVGYFNGTNFVYVAAFGLFTEVSYKTSQQMKNIFGHVAYLLEATKHLLDIPSYSVKVEHDGECLEGQFIYGMITNSLSVGGFKGLTGADVQLDDGLFEVALVKRPHNPLELKEILDCLTGHVEHSEMVYSFKTGEIHFYSEEEIAWTLDGEYGGAHREVCVQNLCRQAKILVCAKTEGEGA